MDKNKNPIKHIENRKGEQFRIFVNKREFTTQKKTLFGREILDLANFDPAKRDLFLITEDGQQRQIKADEEVKIRGTMHFTAIINNPNFG